MNVTELTREQLIELKERYITECYENWADEEDIEECSWGELADADNTVPDSRVLEVYGGYDFTYDDFFNHVEYDDLTTVAKVHCMEVFLNKVIPYDCEDVNSGSIADLEENIRCWIDGQFYIDGDGNWYDDGRKF